VNLKECAAHARKRKHEKVAKSKMAAQNYLNP